MEKLKRLQDGADVAELLAEIDAEMPSEEEELLGITSKFRSHRNPSWNANFLPQALHTIKSEVSVKMLSTLPRSYRPLEQCVATVLLL